MRTASTTTPTILRFYATTLYGYSGEGCVLLASSEQTPSFVFAQAATPADASPFVDVVFAPLVGMPGGWYKLTLKDSVTDATLLTERVYITSPSLTQ